MASKKEFERSVTRKVDIEKQAGPDYEDTSVVSSCSKISSKSIDENMQSPLGKSDTGLSWHTDSAPEKSTEEKTNIGKIWNEKNVGNVGNVMSSKKINDIVDNATMRMELSRPGDTNNEDARISLIEGIKCLKKMKDIGRLGSSMELTPPVPTTIYQQDPEIEQSSNSPSNVPVPIHAGSMWRKVPNFEEPPFVLATHLVPSLPISLFEIIAEILESITGRPVVLLHEARSERPVARNVVDIAFLPAGYDWEEGSLLPVGFVFEHRLNTVKNPDVYVDIVVAQDCVRNIEGIIDLRGYRCSLPDRRKALGAAALLFRHLSLKGENPSFFGDTLDSGSQLSTLQMVAGKQTEIGVLESPVIKCHKNTLPGVDSVYILETLGPLPPYRIMLKKNIQASIREKIIEGLLSAACDVTWMERLGEFGVSGFAEYNVDRYNLEDLKSVVTSVPYY